MVLDWEIILYDRWILCFLGHNKDQWVAIHIWFGIAFLISSVFHLYFNWRILVGYFKKRLVPSFTIKAEWIVALMLCTIVYIDIIYEVPLFIWLTDLEESFKRHGSSQGGQGRYFGQAGMHMLEDQGKSSAEYQEPTISWSSEDNITKQIGRRTGRGIGRKTLREFCSDEGIDLSWASKKLSREGFIAKETMTMREIADVFAVHPSELPGILYNDQ
jgi:hypothetical protein